MRKAIMDHLRDFVAIGLLAALALGVAYYILQKQRLRIPVLEPAPYEVRFEMQTAQAVTPGQGQTVRVSGVRIGDIASIELENGRAIVTAHLDEEYGGLIRTDATALLRPKTGLKDMFIEVHPGSKSAPALKENGIVPVRSTLPDVNPDQFLASLDRDTRDYLKLLLDGAGKGLKGRGGDLREVLARFEPTYRDLARVQSAGAARRRELARLINSLNRLNSELANNDDALAELVLNASRVFRALASRREGLSATVRELEPTLSEAREAFVKVEAMARLLGPTLSKMRPAVRSLRAANPQVREFANEAAPLLRDDIRPFVREARPFVRELRPAAAGLVEAEPWLTRSLTVLNHFFNMLGSNPRGAEGPEVAGRDEGFLFYLSWVTHQSANLFSGADAHGPFRPVTSGGTCAAIQNSVQSEPQMEFLLNLTGALTDPRVCGGVNVPGSLLDLLPVEPAETRGEERTPRDEEPRGAGASDETVSRDAEAVP